MTDAELAALLRTALPAVEEDAPAPDLWPRLASHTGSPAWSWLDLGLAASVVAAFVARPDWLLLLAYHL